MKKYIGMAWPSDGLNDSEYWSYLSANFELLITRYPVIADEINPINNGKIILLLELSTYNSRIPAPNNMGIAIKNENLAALLY